MRVDSDEEYFPSPSLHLAWSWEMNQDGPPNPKSSYPTSSLHDKITVSHYLRSESSLLLTCANSDRGGGVHFGHVFAIYSTATLPSVWIDMLHAPQPPGIYIQRLQAIAHTVSVSLPIYISWDDIKLLPLSPQELHRLTIQPLLMPHPPNFITRFAKTQEIARQKPHFLLNAALHERHCIIGRDSPIETLLVLLRRPWCVLEICVSNRHEKNTGVLEAMLTFARTAQEFDYAGYRTAVFLLEYELLARARTRVYCHSHAMKQGECFGRANAESKGYSFNSSRRVYAMCNTVFLPSLMSFNSFWIRLICVCAIELGVSFSCMINMLCDQKRSQKQATIFSPDLVMPVGVLRHACRRQSEIDMASFWRSREKVVDDHIDESIVEKMLGLYRDVLRRTGDYI